MQATGTGVLVGTLAMALLVGMAWKWGSGRFREATVDGPEDRPQDGEPAPGREAARRPLALENVPKGERATLVQFSSAFCAPCRATRQVLTEVSDMVSGVRYVEIDAEKHLDLVRRLDILRTPTVLVLDARGDVVRRASGQPRKADVIAALGQAID